MPTSANQIESLTWAECATKLDEAVELGTVPNDIRVWKLYLFPLCTRNDQTRRLVNVYALLKKVGLKFEEIGQWCQQGQFVDKALQSLRGSGKIRREYSSEDVRALQELIGATAELHTPVTQTKWLQQFRACAGWRGDTMTPEQNDKLKAYFAMGIIVFEIKPCADWLLQHTTHDIWYDLGYATVIGDEGADRLKKVYESTFRKDFGIASVNFDGFYRIWKQNAFSEKLTPWSWGEYNEVGSLKVFFDDRARREEKSVWRLHQAAIMGNKLMDLGAELEFKDAWKDYGLSPMGAESGRLEFNLGHHDDKTAKRKDLYLQAINISKNPWGLDNNMTDGKIRDWVKKVLGDSISDEELELLP